MSNVVNLNNITATLERGVPEIVVTKYLGVSRTKLLSLVKDGSVATKPDPNGARLYDLREVIRATSDAVLDPDVVADVIRSLKPKELPVEIQKEYWQAQIARQKFEENAADLWRTAAIVDVFAAVFKSLRQEILLFSDTIEAQTGLTSEQREVLFNLSDALLNNLHEALVRNFGGEDLLPGFE